CWATVSSNSAGGVAGDFAPTIFAGAMAGFVYASAVNAIFDVNLPVGIFALLGTAGVFSGAIHAPLMAMFLTAEMANGYGYFLGLVICSALSYLTVKFLTPRSGYYKTDDIHALLHLKKQSGE
ncbi:MAG: chloride channel protein, partial [Muribaculaceae bacterium]|nr:chloride channel protein [Muribaculaceae bacterium]